MPRRNNRQAEEARIANNVLGDEYRFTRDDELAEERKEARKRRAAEMTKRFGSRYKMDWANCVVPGCRFQTQKRLENGIEFPVCSLHAAAVWHEMERRLHSRDDQERTFAEQATEGMNARARDMAQERAELWAEDEVEWQDALKAGLIEGEIYFVRTNGLIKVGWSSDLPKRLRTYGPAAVLLCHYPGYRADETNLHRQLTPCRARGREWYTDGDIIARYIDEAVAKYGQPTVKVQWTEAKEVIAHTIMRR